MRASIESEKLLMKRVIILWVVVMTTCFQIGLRGRNKVKGEVKNAKEVFEKWVTWQKVYPDHSMLKMHEQVGPEFWDTFVSYYDAHHKQLNYFDAFLQSSSLKSLVNEKNRQKHISTLMQIYDWYQNDVGALLTFFKNHNFLNQTMNKREEDENVTSVIYRYKVLEKLLFSHPDKKIKDHMLFSAGNCLFEYCFDKGFHQFKTILKDPKQYQLARFCYANVWFYLVGRGWKDWSENTLQSLAQEAKKGKEIVYVAGGNDIYQLLKNGIYKIRVIDPMLPSQPDYYSEGWKWMVESDRLQKGMGDKIMFRFKNKNLVMRRTKHWEDGTFSARLSTGRTVQLPNSQTTWTVFDNDEKNKIGQVVFERRYCDQADFNVRSDQSLLLSFNEMYHVALPSDMGGWGINVNKFAPDFSVYVKQLRKPVSKKIVQNLRIAEKTDFNFILLGSCAT